MARLAQQRGSDESVIVSQMIAHALDYEEWFIQEVEKGQAELDRGEFVEHEEVKARIERLLRAR